MSPFVLIDTRNIDFVDDKQAELFNEAEIIRNVRQHGAFEPIAVSIINMVFGFFSLFALLFNTMGIVEDFTGFGFGHVLVYIVFLPMFYISVLGSYVVYHWRKGIRDKTIVDNIRKQGKVVTGEITDVLDDTITYQFEVKGMLSTTVRTGKFFTEHADRLQRGDKVAVVYVFYVVSFLL